MRGLNKVFLVGRVGNDPEVKNRKGKSFSRLSVATHRVRMNPDGEGKDEQTIWHSVFVWGKQGEICAQYLKKGAPVLIEGYLNSYTTKNEEGQTQWRHSINADRVDFLPSGGSHLQETKFDS